MMDKAALIERLMRLGATDVPGTPRLLMRQRSPQELAQLQEGVTAGIGKLQAPLRRGVDAAAGALPPGRLQSFARKAGNLAIDNPEILPMQAVPIPGLTPAWLAAKKGLEKGIDHIAPLPKTAAGAPTRGGFMQASDIPPYRPPRLDQAVQKDGSFEGKSEKDGDALPDGVVDLGGFRPVNLNAKHASGLASRMITGAVLGAAGGAGYHGLKELTPKGAPSVGAWAQSANMSQEGTSPSSGAAIQDAFRWHGAQGTPDLPYRRGSFVMANLHGTLADPSKLPPGVRIDHRPTGGVAWGDVSKEDLLPHADAVMSHEVGWAPGSREELVRLIEEAKQPWYKRKSASGFTMTTEKMAEFVEGLLKTAIPGLTPQSRLEQSSSIGAPRASAPPGPSIAQIAKPAGPGFGSGIAGAGKASIGGGSVGGIGAMKPPPSL
jgi:hypothetical protein